MPTELFSHPLPPLSYMIAESIRQHYLDVQSWAGLTDYETELLIALKLIKTKEIWTLK